jgi:hypothetical protein
LAEDNYAEDNPIEIKVLQGNDYFTYVTTDLLVLSAYSNKGFPIQLN